MSRSWSWLDRAEQQRQAAKLRQIAVDDVRLRHMTVVATASVWGLLAADVQRWVDAAEMAAETPGATQFPETPPPPAP